jgi:hypothetical protein
LRNTKVHIADETRGGDSDLAGALHIDISKTKWEERLNRNIGRQNFRKATVVKYQRSIKRAADVGQW